MRLPDLRGHPLLPLRVKGLTYVAGGKHLIDGLDLTIHPGRLTVIMGANGAGKSLLLRLLHGLLPAQSGEIDWAGQPAESAQVGEQIRARQAMVFQRPVLLRRTVQANMNFVLRLKPGLSAEQRRRRSDQLLTRVGLLDRAEQPARLLSGGEQQRLALARALATGPELLWLDEATASLDPASIQIIESIVLECHQAGMGIIAVTHDIGQARRLADDIVFLHQGQVAEASAASDFFAHPVSAPAKAYLAGRLYLE